MYPRAKTSSEAETYGDIADDAHHTGHKKHTLVFVDYLARLSMEMTSTYLDLSLPTRQAALSSTACHFGPSLMSITAPLEVQCYMYLKPTAAETGARVQVVSTTESQSGPYEAIPRVRGFVRGWCVVS